MHYKVLFIVPAILLAGSSFAFAGSSANSNSGSHSQSSSGVYMDSHDSSDFASAAIAPGLTATAPCMGSSSVGGSGSGFGFSFGTTWKDSECSARENSRYMTILTGNKGVGVKIMCTIEDVARAVPEVCGYAGATRQVRQTAEVPTKVVRSFNSMAACRRYARNHAGVSCRAR